MDALRKLIDMRVLYDALEAGNVQIHLDDEVEEKDGLWMFSVPDSDEIYLLGNSAEYEKVKEMCARVDVPIYINRERVKGDQ